MSDEKIKLFLSDLGRATLRGVRRCPKCGTYNGTRGLSCKKCSCLFKEKRKFNAEACKLVTGNSTQIYSVRVHDKGPDYRGFVQLPLMQTKIAHEADNFALSESALCFVESCQRLFDTSILKCHEPAPEPETETETDQCLETPMCQHIEAAIKCANEATILDINNAVLNALHFSNDIKQDIYQLDSQSPAPLVQRLSKNVMAVKCLVSAKHPLGYLHLSFITQKIKDTIEHKYYCSCTDFKAQNRGSSVGQYKHESPYKRKCVHFYACISAFASDAKLAEEFAHYVNMEQQVPLLNSSSVCIEHPEPEPEPLDDANQLVSMLDNDDLIDPRGVCDIEVEVLSENTLLAVPNIIADVIEPNVQIQNLEIHANGEVTIIRGLHDDTLSFTDLSDNLPSLSDAIDISQTLEIIPIKKAKIEKQKNRRTLVNDSTIRQKKVPMQRQDTTLSSEEKRTQISFIEWLASVTERVNQTMHYQFSGTPDPLIFHVPQVFFDCLRERISYGGTKKRLPNFTSAFIRKDAVPLGTFTKYTWHITNILHVKQIFETALVPLKITKSFVQNRDGTYDLYQPKGDENDGMKKDGLIPIKPLELKTYLKVGHTSQTQEQPTPFVIEWIPDILPLSKIGELRIRFEFGHQKEVNCLKNVKKTKKFYSECS